MEQAISAFLAQLQSEGRTANTLSAYAGDLRHFCAYLHRTAPAVDRWFQVGEAELTGYFASLARAGRSPATLARRRVALGRFLRFLGTETGGHLPAFPQTGQANTAADEPDTSSAVLTAPEVAAFFDGLDRLGGPFARRDRALLKLLWDTGLTISALVGLDVADVALAERELLLPAKTGKPPARIPLSAAGAAALADYLSGERKGLLSRTERVGADQNALFLNHRGRRLTRQGGWLIVSQCAAACGIDKPVSPRSLRRSREEQTVQSSSLYLY